MKFTPLLRMEDKRLLSERTVSQQMIPRCQENEIGGGMLSLPLLTDFENAQLMELPARTTQTNALEKERGGKFSRAQHLRCRWVDVCLYK